MGALWPGISIYSHGTFPIDVQPSECMLCMVFKEEVLLGWAGCNERSVAACVSVAL